MTKKVKTVTEIPVIDVLNAYFEQRHVENEQIQEYCREKLAMLRKRVIFAKLFESSVEKEKG